ncbi:lactonase family protein [Streptomyces sp. W16]|uniref:lactonase family protein n=1 Tax=Streptomyces sp. W16 TaxID=3076631 RepID=UPI00295BBF57|nr:lactonase family protein [Streptomyces sp. W16]MDV9174044.1 lactonase family protein [Streptomyces sp. W16]
MALTATATATAVPPAAEAAPQARPDLLHVGSWNGGQVHAVLFDPVQGVLTSNGPVAQVSSGWVTAHPDRPLLYVGSQLDGGIVTAFAVDRTTGALTRTGQVSTDGGGTAGGGLSYLGVDRPSDTLLVANFEAGLATSLPIRGDGTLGAPLSVVVDTGSGPSPRQTGPHPHQVVVAPGRRHALVPDFGADRVFVHRFDGTTGALSPGETGPGAYATDAGAGPRRLVLHPDGRKAYLLTELTAELQLLDWDGRSGELTHRQSLTIDSPDFTGTKSGAELAISRDGRFVYASSRGENTLVVYEIERRTGLLSLLQRIPSGGLKPWSFTVHPSGRWLLVANEASSTVDVFAVDPRTGLLTGTGNSLPLPNPDSIAVCVR